MDKKLKAHIIKSILSAKIVTQCADRRIHVSNVYFNEVGRLTIEINQGV